MIISVGAGFPQTPFIKKLKEMGYIVASFGFGRNDPKAIELSDYFENINTANSKEAIKWLENLRKPIHGAGSFAGGVAIDTLQKIERHFNLPTKIPESLSIGMDKYSQQELYSKLGLSKIKTFKTSELLFNYSQLNSNSLYILKPVIGRGSSGVYKLKGEDLKKWIAEKKLSDGDLVQEFIEGTEYRLLAIVQNEKLKLIAQVKRDSLEGTFLLGRLTVVNTHNVRLQDFLKKLITISKIKNAIIKLDVIINEYDINMIEMDIGVGGGIYYKKFIESVYNLDLTEEYIRLITNQDLDIQGTIKSNNDLKMDYIFNYTKGPIRYNLQEISKYLEDLVGKHKVVENLLNPSQTGKFETNADFIFTIIHQNKDLSTIDLNKNINRLFEKI